MDFFELIKSIFYGIIQGITEWLPVSSTGHMILAEQFVKLDVSKKFWDNIFLVLIQLGSVLAVMTLYFQKLNPLSRKKTKEQSRQTFSLWIKIIIGVIPACIVGFAFEDAINKYCYNAVVVALMLIIYGVAFILVERNQTKPRIKNISELDYKTAFLIGMFQVLALIPGTSRSGATILGAIMIGASRQVAAEFSFFLAIPVELGASLLKILKHHDMLTDSNSLGILIVGTLTAFIVSVIVIKFLMSYIRKHDFKAFGYYRILIGILVLLYFLTTGAKVII